MMLGDEREPSDSIDELDSVSSEVSWVSGPCHPKIYEFGEHLSGALCNLLPDASNLLYLNGSLMKHSS